MEVGLDNKLFLQPLDSENTKASIYYIRHKFMKYYDYRRLGDWRTAILKQNCGKGKMMLFLYWICANYLGKNRKKGKRRSIHIYWRDFKMLYCRVNGEYVDTNDRHEVVKYIDGILKVDFELDTTSKLKLVAGPDDLLLMLVQYWARDESVFPTEDDSEFVHSSKDNASQDPLGEREEINKNLYPWKAVYCDDDDELEYDSDSDAGDDPGSDDDVLFDSEDDGSDGNDGADEAMDEHGCSDSGYNSDGTDVTMTEDMDKCYTTEINECGKPLRQYEDFNVYLFKIEVNYNS
ncbi:hypothetical protein B7463_g8769, partial [Scytalidium lignicola]